MTKLRKFLGLEFMTIKPVLNLKTVLLFSGIVFAITFSAKTTVIVPALAFALAIMSLGLPFIATEKSGTDSLYITLTLARKDVVFGRFVAIFLFDIFLFAYVYAVSLMTKLVASLFDYVIFDEVTAMGFFCLLAGVLVLQTTQLPFYWKLGAQKARFYTICPFLVLFLLYACLDISVNGTTLKSIVIDFGMKLFDNRPLIIAIILAVTATFTAISYALSLKFYKKRDF